MNTITKDKQCTTLWNVDNLKTSHVDPVVISRVLAEIDAEYEKIWKMTITRGKVHKYLGMTIDYSSPGKVIFLMIDYIGNMIDDITESMKGESDTPDAHQLFEISEDTTNIYQANADIFHNFEAKLIYLPRRARPYIHIAPANES